MVQTYTRVTPEYKRRAVAQRAAEIAERRAVFDANNNNRWGKKQEPTTVIETKIEEEQETS